METSQVGCGNQTYEEHAPLFTFSRFDAVLPDKALTRDKTLRYQTASEFLADLKAKGLYRPPMSSEEWLAVSRFLAAFNLTEKQLRYLIGVDNIGISAAIHTYKNAFGRWPCGREIWGLIDFRNTLCHETEAADRFGSIPTPAQINAMERILVQLGGRFLPLICNPQ